MDDGVLVLRKKGNGATFKATDLYWPISLNAISY